MVAVYDILGGDALFAGADGDGHSMLVAASDHLDILAAQAKETGVDVGRDINSGEVADVYRAVGVGEGSGDKSPFEVLLHLYIVFLMIGTV